MANVGRWTREDREKLFAESIEHWTPEAQEDMLVEECAELIVAMNKFRRKPSLETLDHLSEEMADVLFMIEEIVFYHDKYGNDSSTEIYSDDPITFGAMIEAWFESKLDRTAKRLENSKAREVIDVEWTESRNT